MMIECTLDVLKNMDQYSDYTEFFAYKVSRKDGTSFLYADTTIFECKKASIWGMFAKDDEKNFIPLTHAVGTKFEVLSASTTVTDTCAQGINVGTLVFIKDFVPMYKHANYKDINGPYCLDNSDKEFFITLWKVKFTKKDIASIPRDFVWNCKPADPVGKFRLFRCEVIEELPLSLLEIKEEVIINDPVAAA